MGMVEIIPKKSLGDLNRGYTDKTHLRGFKTLDFVLVHGGGLCLCSRDFQSPNTFKTQLLREK